jgi:radical SAM protein with 4Fe4S-binding SPASM domain
MKALRVMAGTWGLAVKPVRVPTLPLHLNIEPTTCCNYSCLMCNRDLISKPTHMGLDLFDRVLDEVKPLKVSLNGFGETFLNPHVFEMIDHAAQAGAHIVTSTNGSFLARDSEHLSDCKLSVLRVSLDSATPETYLAIRGKENFEEVTDNISTLVRLAMKRGNQMTIRLEFVIQNQNQREIEDFVKLAARLGVKFAYFQIYSEPSRNKKIKVVGGFDHDGLGQELRKAAQTASRLGVNTNLRTLLVDLEAIRTIYEGRAPAHSGVCINPWITSYIAVNGDVWGCCRFVTRKLIVGNLKNQSFSEIWNGENFLKLRDSLKRKTDLNIVCRECRFNSLLDLMKMRLKLLPGF